MDAEDNMDAPSGSKRGQMSIRIEEANESSDSLEPEDNDSNEEAIPKELQDFSLPAEVWIHAWSFLDFNTRQKICTLVSKTWLNQIRNSSVLSGEMKIFRSDTEKFEEFENADAVLSRWKKLKVLHVESETEIQHFGNFNEHKLLEKIVIWGKNSPRKQSLSKELGSWGIVTKSWFNPKLPLNPTTLENIVAIEIDLGKIPPNFEMEKTAQRLKNLKSLQIYYGGSRAIVSEIGFISSFKNLKNVDFHMNSPLQDLIATLNYLASLNLNISGQINVSGSLEQQRNVFEEAVRILNEKFPEKHEKDESFLYIFGNDMSMSIRFDGNSASLVKDAFLEVQANY